MRFMWAMKPNPVLEDTQSRRGNDSRHERLLSHSRVWRNIRMNIFSSCFIPQATGRSVLRSIAKYAPHTQYMLMGVTATIQCETIMNRA